MSLESTFTTLRREIAGLQEALSALQVTIAEDKPPRGSAALVDRLDNVVTDLAGALEEAGAAAARAQQSFQPNGPLDGPRGALVDVHRSVNRFTAAYISELALHDHIAQLLEMGRERGRDWRDWSQVVKTAIERCAIPAELVCDAVLESWSELTDRLARNSVSVQATNIGQQITVRDNPLEMAGKAT